MPEPTAAPVTSAPSPAANGAPPKPPSPPAAVEPPKVEAAKPAEGADPAKPADAKPPEPREGKLMEQVRAKERKNVERDQQLARKEGELAQREQRFLEAARGYQDERDMAKRDPLEYLRKIHGWKDDEIGARLLNGGKPDPNEAITRELAELRKFREQEEQRRAADAQKSHYEAAVSSFIALRGKHPERWPLANKLSDERAKTLGLQISATDRKLTDEDIYDRIEEHLADVVRLVNPKQETSKEQPSKKPEESTPGSDGKPAPTLAAASSERSTPAQETVKIGMTPDQEREFTLRRIKELRSQGLIRD